MLGHLGQPKLGQQRGAESPAGQDIALKLRLRGGQPGAHEGTLCAGDANGLSAELCALALAMSASASCQQAIAD
mgnify:CR=1 FL=1